jgi:hypothetical protein
MLKMFIFLSPLWGFLRLIWPDHLKTSHISPSLKKKPGTEWGMGGGGRGEEMTQTTYAHVNK